MILGPCQETSFTAINPESLYSPKEESFPIPLKHIDVSRTTHTNLDVKQEKRIDDYWNIDVSRDLSDPWTGFTQFTLVEEKSPDGYMWSGGRWTRKQLTSRPDHLWPELWKSMGKYAKLKEKQKRSNEKIHLENARKLQGIYFIDPKDTEFKEIIKNARQKLETSVDAAMLVKLWRKIVGVVHPTKLRQKLRVFWKPMNPSECVWSRRPYCRKRWEFITALQLGSQIDSHAWSNENSCSNSSSGQGMGKIGENFGVELDQSQK